MENVFSLVSKLEGVTPNDLTVLASFAIASETRIRYVEAIQRTSELYTENVGEFRGDAFVLTSNELDNALRDRPVEASLITGEKDRTARALYPVLRTEALAYLASLDK